MIGLEHVEYIGSGCRLGQHDASSLPDGQVGVPLIVAFAGIWASVEDWHEAFGLLEAFIRLIQEEPDDVQEVVVSTLLKAMDGGDE